MRTALLLTINLYILLFSSNLCWSQTPQFILNKRVGVQINSPEDVAVDSQGNIYYASESVVKFSYHEFLGTEFLEYVPDGLNKENYGKFSIALDQHDNLYVVSNTYSKVAKFSPEGRLLLTFGTEGEGSDQFYQPEAIAINSKNEIYVADRGNKRIQRFNENGNLLQTIPLNQSIDPNFEVPLSIDFDADDNLYVLHYPENTVSKYSPAGDKILEFGNSSDETSRLQNPCDLAVDKLTGQIYVTDLSLNGFYIYDSGGSFITRLEHNTGQPQLSGSKMSIAFMLGETFVIADKRDRADSQILMYLKGGGEGLHRWGNHWQTQELTMDEEGSVYLLETSGRISKFNSAGEVLTDFGVTSARTYSEKGADIIVKASKAITTDLFNNIFVLSSPESNNDTVSILKFDKEGKFLSRFTDFGPGSNSDAYSDLAVDATGNLYIANMDGGYIHKINSQGQHVGTIGSPGFGPGQIWMPLAVAVDRTGVVHVLDYNGGRVQQFDKSGNFIRLFGKFSKEDGSLPSNSDMALDGRGYIYVASNLQQSRYWIFNSRGDLIHEETDRIINHISVDQFGTRMVIDDYQADAYSLYITDSNPSSLSTINGVVYADVNQNCIYDQGDVPLSDIPIMALPGPQYAITDTNGSYTLKIEPGEYTLHSVIPTQPGKTITPTCPSPEQVNHLTVTTTDQLIQGVDFGNYVYAPAHLSVSVSSTRRRRCFESTTTIRYENSGFAPAPDAKVYVKLPAEVELLSADKAYTRLSDGTYAFAVGDLAARQSGTITIQDKVSCGDESVRGRTVCTRAWITPSNYPPIKPTPTVTITGRCDAGSGRIRFVIKNSGKADMEQYEQFRKFVDGSLASKEQFRLAAGDSMVLWVPSMGYTWRMEADQPEGNGDNKIASVTIEACTDANAGTTVSSGFVNILPTDDEEAEVSEECLMITDSYDPNDKLVTPVGRTAEHYTSTNTELKYKIRFQNTGTDVAYRVVVVDTLSEYLDLSTLQVGVASHTHRFEVSGKGRPVLTWTFDNILLPDSTANEPGSHGYIQFSIKPKADLPEKTSVENFADIFFDYNSPVRTNVTVNRIYDMPLVVDEAVRVNLEDVLATPAIAAFEPASGKFGTEITITGKRFASDATANKVYLNGKAATVVSATNSELRVLVPTGAATGALRVITPDGGVTASEIFEVYQPPVLSSFSPAEGTAGQTVTLQGQNLRISQLPEVYLGAQQCSVSMAGTGELQVVVPSGAATGAFRISTEGGEAQSSQTYRVWQQPVITALSKHTDRAGSELRITGADFAEQAARNKVYFGQAAAKVLQATASSLLVEIPSTAGAGKVKVITPGGEVLSDQTFELIPGPVLVQIHPAKGSVGNVVELRGQHFLISNKQDTVSFNGIKAVVLSASPELFKVQVPRGVSTGKVEIKGVGGAALSTQDFVVEDLSLAESVIISPNPSDGSFALDLHRADFEVQRLQVYSSLGQLVLEQSITTPRPDTLQVQLRKPQSGIYLLRLHTDRGLLTLKLYVR